MNKEYIEREAALNAMSKAQSDRTWSMDNCDVMDQMFDYVEKVPAADVAPVIHGGWIHKNGEIYCSVCDSEALMDEVYYESSYCPDCGAKMDGGK